MITRAEIEELFQDEQTQQVFIEITSTMSCPKDFVCIRSGGTVLCKAKDIGLHSYLECLEEDPANCRFSVGFGFSHLCTCPLRVYLAKRTAMKEPA